MLLLLLALLSAAPVPSASLAEGESLQSQCAAGDGPACFALSQRLALDPGAPALAVAIAGDLPCGAEDPQTASCEGLREALGAGPAAAPLAEFLLLFAACEAAVPQACERALAVGERLAGRAGELARSLSHERCAPDTAWACRLGLRLGHAGAQDLLRAELSLCAQAEPARCLAASERSFAAGSPTQGAWALAMACSVTGGDACPRLRRLVALAVESPGPAASRAEVLAHLRVGALLARLGPPGASAPPRFGPEDFSCLDRKAHGDEDCRFVSDWLEATNPAVSRWFQRLPPQQVLALVRRHALCGALAGAGLSEDLLTLPVEVLGLEESETARFSVCAENWNLATITHGQVEPGEDRDRTVWMRGPLEPRADFSAFQPITVARLKPPSGPISVGVEALAGFPVGAETFAADTGMLLLRAQSAFKASFEFQYRVGVGLPIGAHNPFSLQLGLGTLLGSLTAGPVHWRVVTAWLDGWLVFAPLSLALVPSVGTQLALALGRQELALELGARLPIPLLPSGVEFRPVALRPAPFVALLFRPSF